MYDDDPLFLGPFCKNRISGNVIYENIVRIEKKAGLHVPNGRTEQRAMVKVFRHSFVKNAKLSGMESDYIAEQRGDKRDQSQDVYNRIDTDELKFIYDRHIYNLPV